MIQPGIPSGLGWDEAMRCLTFLNFFLLLPCLAAALADAGHPEDPDYIYENTVLTTSLGNWEPEPIEVWESNQPPTEPFRAAVMAHAGPDAEPTFLILMEEGTYDLVGDSLMLQWMGDMVAEGFVVEAVEITYSAVVEIRDYLTAAWELGLLGAVLVGDLPVPVSMHEWAYGSETFPSDYYFMDLDGIWEDNWIGYPSAMNPGMDGYFDGWTGELDPEIYTGRIVTSNLQGDEIQLIQQYLERNHDRRMNGDTEPVTALCYVDDDWASWGPEYQAAMQLLYPNTVLINDYGMTSGSDYMENRLPAAYVWTSPYVHSDPNTHYFSPGPYVYWTDVVSIDPPAHFFNLFACSNCRFTTANNMGGTYTFVNTHGLGTVGSCKTGSMLRFSYFYGPMGEGGCLGVGYRDWWDEIALDGLTTDEIGWHLGMVLLGDPTLVPAMHQLGIEDGAEDGVVASVKLLAVPNPCSGALFVECRGVPSALVQVWDLSGRLVTSGRLEDGALCLSVEEWPAGVYVVSSRLESGQLARALFTVID